jgi:hypothetical protein
MGRPGPYLSLREVRRLVRERRVLVWRKALDSARQDFGWGMMDVLEAVCCLGKKHFSKTEPCRVVKGAMVDYFKARGLRGEDVYVHLYIDPDSRMVNVQSGKRLI